MKRFILAGLTTLTLCATMISTASADPTAFNSYQTTSSTSYRIPPSDLVSTAQRGYLREQGIPGYLGLASAYTLGQIGAKEVVQAAANAKLLPTEAVSDQAYLNQVNFQLQTQVRVR